MECMECNLYPTPTTTPHPFHPVYEVLDSGSHFSTLSLLATLEKTCKLMTKLLERLLQQWWLSRMTRNHRVRLPDFLCSANTARAVFRFRVSPGRVRPNG